MKEPIHIIIPVKQSHRYPGKNRALYGFTLQWLYQELLDNPELQYTLTIVGDPKEVPYLPENANILVTDCKSQYYDILTAARQYNEADIFVHLQLTQPVRQRGLLKKAIQAYLDTHIPVISATMMYDESWRVLNKHGNWKGNCKDYDKKVAHYDGAIYVWQPDNLKNVFNKDAQHIVIIQDLPWLIDVDYKDDVPVNIFDKVNETSIIDREWQ